MAHRQRPARHLPYCTSREPSPLVSAFLGRQIVVVLQPELTKKIVDPTRPMRFIIVDTPELFKPEYWNQVVAVFTTGQVWQFKNYRWQQPTDLFRNTLGVYVGWRGDALPDTVKGWGRGVMSVGVDKYVPSGSRWRDREVVEGIWKSIEEGMRSKGWRRDSGPLA